ncbi:MAG: cysteine-rich CWC family protein [Myxococcota bacterium]
MSDPAQPKTGVCPLCSQPNACALARAEAGDAAPCWCAARSFPPDLLAQAAPTACICAACLDAHETSGEADASPAYSSGAPKGDGSDS